MGKKAQSAVEFAVLVTIMFLVFTVFFYAVSTKLSEVQRDNDLALLEDLASFVQNELRLATVAEEGYYRTFELPVTLSGTQYEIEVTDYGDSGHTDIVVSYVNYTRDYVHVLPVGNVTGSIDVRKNTRVTVQKTGNVVIVST